MAAAGVLVHSPSGYRIDAFEPFVWDHPTEDPPMHTTNDADTLARSDATSLADVISFNALFSLVSGVVLSTGVVASRLGIPPLVALGVGAGLVGFAVVLLVGLARVGHLRTVAMLAVAADLGWITAACLLLLTAPEALSPTGRVTLAAVTVVVALLAPLQGWGLRRIGRRGVTGTTALHAAATTLVAAPASDVWAAVADAGGFARFADGIAATDVIGPVGPGMVRSCTDNRGASWTERCTAWDEGHRYRMTVDVSTYPWQYRALFHALSQTWTVEPRGQGTRLGLDFDGQIKLGLVGRLAATTLRPRQRIEDILAHYEEQLRDTKHATDRAATNG